MRQGVMMWPPLVVLAFVFSFILDAAQFNLEHTVLLSVVVVLMATAVAVYKGIEAYSAILCGIGILSSLMAAVIPFENWLLALLLLPAIAPMMMQVLLVGETTSVVYRVAFQKGLNSTPEDTFRGEHRQGDQDAEVALIIGIFDSKRPTSATEARELARWAGYTDVATVTHAYQQYKLPSEKKKKAAEKANKRNRRTPLSTIDGMGLSPSPKRGGGF